LLTPKGKWVGGGVFGKGLCGGFPHKPNCWWTTAPHPHRNGPNEKKKKGKVEVPGGGVGYHPNKKNQKILGATTGGDPPTKTKSQTGGVVWVKKICCGEKTAKWGFFLKSRLGGQNWGKHTRPNKVCVEKKNGGSPGVCPCFCF